MSTETLEIGSGESPPDPAEAPEGATGDGSKVELEADASTKPEDAPEGGQEGGEGGERPEWLDEKFKSPEDLQKAYNELQTKLGQKDDGEGDSGSGEDSAGEAMTLEAAAAEYAENGELSDEAYAKFEAAGLGRDLVDSFIEDQVNQVEKVRAKLLETVGGQEAFQQISEWALANKSEAEIEGFDKAMRSGDEEIAKMALKGLRADYVEANGQEPDLVTADDSSVRTGPEPFGSWDQVTEAMSNPKYKSDPAYRAKVDKRLAVSDL